MKSLLKDYNALTNSEITSENDILKKTLVIFSSTDGHTQKISEVIVDTINKKNKKLQEQFNQDIDELGEETNSLVEKIEKWQI